MWQGYVDYGIKIVVDNYVQWDTQNFHMNAAGQSIYDQLWLVVVLVMGRNLMVGLIEDYEGKQVPYEAQKSNMLDAIILVLNQYIDSLSGGNDKGNFFKLSDSYNDRKESCPTILLKKTLLMFRG